MRITATLVTLFTLFSIDTFAADYMRWGLPEGAKARLGKGRISGNIAYSPDGTRLAVGSSIGIWLYDTATFQVENSPRLHRDRQNGEVALLTEHTDKVLSVAFSPDGNTIATGRYDGTIRLWDTETEEPKTILTGDGDMNPAWDVRFRSDGNTIVSYHKSEGWYEPIASPNDETVRFWDARTGAPHTHPHRAHG